MNNRNDLCEERVSDLKDKLEAQYKILQDTLKTRKQGKLIQQLLDDAKTDLRLIGVIEKLEGSTHRIKKPGYTNKSRKQSLEKELNIHVSEGIQNSK